MRYKMIYILFLIFLLITIPYVITVFLSQQDKNIQFENYDSGYQVISGNDKDDLETYLLKICRDRFLWIRKMKQLKHRQ